MTRLSRLNRICAAILLFAATTLLAPAQTLTTLVEFDGDNGFLPRSTLTQGPDGNLYGTTSGSASPYDGTVFKMSFSGDLTPLYGFICNVSRCPQGGDVGGGLLLGTDGFFYGTTTIGGSSYHEQCGQYGCGTVFKISSKGNLTTLHNFEGMYGVYPNSLVRANGNYMALPPVVAPMAAVPFTRLLVTAHSQRSTTLGRLFRHGL